MKYKPYILVLLFIFYGCSYNGYLQKDFHKPEQTATSKINLSVAIINSQEWQDYRIQEYTGGYTYTFYINPAFTEELSKELNKNVFSKIEIVNSMKDLNKFDLMIIPSLSFKYIDGSAWNGQYRYQFVTTLIVKDSYEKLIDEFKNTQDVIISPSPGAVALSILTGLSLFVLSPITIPAGTQLSGDNAKATIEEAISRSLKALSYDLSNSPKIYNYKKHE
jgi:hypothetical protein